LAGNFPYPTAHVSSPSEQTVQSSFIVAAGNDENMTSPSHSILPELSRTFKSREYRRSLSKQDDRKRKRPITSSSSSDENHQAEESYDYCFQVRPSNNGVGMFATKPIACGDLIIKHEEPIVHVLATPPPPTRTAATTNNNIYPTSSFCHVCVTPLGSLRSHHLSAPLDLALPGLDAHEQGVLFTTDHKTCPECHHREVASWCSTACWEKGRQQHAYLCDNNSNTASRSLHEFFSRQENPIIFQLATQVILLLVCNLETWTIDNNSNNKIKSKDDEPPLDKLFWWKDYGSHPLWWTIGASENWTKRKEQTVELFTELQRLLLSKQPQKKTHPAPWKHPMDTICTVENIGSILGMLQCNVMEFSYPSPLQQYMEQVEDIMATSSQDGEKEEEEEKEHGNATITNPLDILALEKGLAWIEKHISMPNNDNTTANASDNKLLPANPVLGSGLYPLLTLANHNCNPNASIEFLKESNQGSMVALRDIPVGEEICITYVPNGNSGLDASSLGDDAEDSGNFFRHFEATRTWKWLNVNSTSTSGSSLDGDGSYEETETEESMENNDCEDEEEDANIDRLQTQESINGDRSGEEMEESLLEGADPIGRDKALLEYGFQCQCSRCLSENKGRSR
jgi:hypothetical protein